MPLEISLVHAQEANKGSENPPLSRIRKASMAILEAQQSEPEKKPLQ